MLDIILLIFLCRHIGKIAVKKGLSGKTWKIYTILAFLCGELMGMGISMNIYGIEQVINLLKSGNSDSLIVMAISIFCAIGGYLLIKFILEKKPDALEEEIKNIGVDDLKP